MEVATLITAAGMSRRMGHPKALLPHPLHPTHSFITYLVATFSARACTPVVIVTNPSLEQQLQEALAPWAHACQLAVNVSPRAPMISSVRLAIQTLSATAPQVSAALLTPVDQPLVTPSLITELMAAHERQPEKIILPRHEGNTGHPVLLPAAVLTELLTQAADGGAHTVVHHDPARIAYLEWEDDTICADVDTPGEYARLAGLRSPAGMNGTE